MAELPIGKRVINKSKSEQRINLKSLLGRTPTREEKTAFTLATIELINQRTLDGSDIDGKKFEQYSEEYADKKGVSRNAVDLFLSGDMLDSIDVVDTSTNTVTIGIEGELNRLKSDNHNNGVTLPKREFFGITKDEAERIANSIKSQETESTQEGFTLADIQQALASLGLEQTRD
jgi:phage gpG-like protein